MTRKIKEDTYMDTAADCEECDEDVLFIFIFIFIIIIWEAEVVYQVAEVVF
jgi:hypothetical protein